MRFKDEKEADSKLPFLDILVVNDGRHLYTSVYRKPSFTGLGTSFFTYFPTLADPGGQSAHAPKSLKGGTTYLLDPQNTLKIINVAFLA